MRVSTNVSAALAYVDFSQTSTFATRFAENMVGPKGQINFPAGDSFWVVPIPEGDYMWSKFLTGNRFSNIQSSNRFRISRGAITYVGDLRIDVQPARFNMNVKDNSDLMQLYLKDKYPSYSNTMSFNRDLLEIRW